MEQNGEVHVFSMIGCLTLDVGLFNVVNNEKFRTTVMGVRAHSNDGVQPAKRSLI